jgi:histidine triad (HIT) family protein
MRIMATIFERIISGELPATIVYRDDRVTAFRDIHPRAPVRTFSSCRTSRSRPANDIAGPMKPSIGHVFVVARGAGAPRGHRRGRLPAHRQLQYAHGGQEVYHLHLHLLGGKPLGPMVSV